MNSLTLTEPTLGALLSLVESQPGASNSIFRGHSDAAWGLCRPYTGRRRTS